ncbi:MAG: hypothetical protein SGJ27_22760 [Candidatus Melainabacteria bacterium]|nr:hypothetical protein [Candidatus Melainabacteria bacterium]
MTEIKPSAKLTFRKPLTVDRWYDWDIVVDALPVADFGEPDNKTLNLSEGTHEIYLRQEILPGVYKSTQRLRVALRKGDDVTIRLGPDPKNYLFAAFGLATSFLSVPLMHDSPGMETVGAVVFWVSLTVMALVIFAVIKGFAFRLSIVETDDLPSELTSVNIATDKKSIEADPIVRSLASEFAEKSAIKKTVKIPLSVKARRSNSSTFFLIAGLILFDKPSPVDMFGMVSLAVAALTLLISADWRKEEILKNISFCAFMIASLIGLAVVFGPPIGEWSQTVFLSMSLCLGVSVAMNFGYHIAKSMSGSKTAGIITLVLYSGLAVYFVSALVPSMLTFVALHK